MPSAVYRSSCTPGSFADGTRVATGPHPDTVANTVTQMAGAVNSSATQRSPRRWWSTSTSGCRGMELRPKWFNGRVVTTEFRWPMVMLYQWLTNGNQPQRKILLLSESLATGHERLIPAHRHSTLCKGFRSLIPAPRPRRPPPRMPHLRACPMRQQWILRRTDSN